MQPWRDDNEWKETYKRLYSNDLNERRKGLEDVAVWRARSRVPTAVESAAFFVTAQFSVSSLSERMAISMAVLRMVNGLVDTHQKKEFAQSVRSISTRIGLPRLLVDLRHEATHNKLPSLPTLRLGLSLALDWLNENYWIPTWKEYSNPNNHVEERDIYDKIRDLLMRVPQIQKRKSNKRKQNTTWSESMKVLAEDAAMRTKSNETLRNMFLTMFLDGTNINAALLQKETDFDRWNEALTCLSSIYPWIMTELLTGTLSRLRYKTLRKAGKDRLRLLALNFVRRRHLWPEMIYETLPETKVLPCFPVHKILEICASNLNTKDSWPLDVMQAVTDTCSTLLNLELGHEEAQIVHSMLGTNEKNVNNATTLIELEAELVEEEEEEEDKSSSIREKRWEYCEDFCPCVLGSSESISLNDRSEIVVEGHKDEGEEEEIDGHNDFDVVVESNMSSSIPKIGLL
jgi:hypothetical protein